MRAGPAAAPTHARERLGAMLPERGEDAVAAFIRTHSKKPADDKV